MNDRKALVDPATTRARLVLGAAAALCLLVAPIATATTGGGGSDARVSASVKKSVKKLNKKLAKLAQQLAELERQPGPQGPAGTRGTQGQQGVQGPPGPSTGPAGGDLSGTYPDPAIADAAVTLPKLAGSSVNASKVVNNSLTGADIDESTLAGLWREGGNAGTGAGDFLGTTDNQPLELRANDARALRLEPASDGTNESPNVIGGIADNSVTSGAHSATIGGGGRFDPNDPATANEVTDNFGTVGGGADNQAGDGAGTTSGTRFATVGGGLGSTASGDLATVGGGGANRATASESAVGGGLLNTASGGAAVVSGGFDNTASATDTSVGGGFHNEATGDLATAGGGNTNTASGIESTVPGGSQNTAAGQFSTVPGGVQNTAAGTVSFAAGAAANADHAGSFVWADASGFNFPSTALNQFSVRSTGGARFVSAIDGSGTPTAGVQLAAGGGSWASLSDAASKRAVEPASGRTVLRKLESVPISTWRYRSQHDPIHHIGPMAQDFFRAFGVGEDRRHIATVDADGVALAAIKGLSRRVDHKDARIDALERRLDRVEREVAR